MIARDPGVVLGLAAACLIGSLVGAPGCRTPDDRAGTVPPDEAAGPDAGGDGAPGEVAPGPTGDGGTGGAPGGNAASLVSVSVRFVHLTPVDKASRLALYVLGGASPLISDVGFAKASAYRQVQLPSHAAELVVRLSTDGPFAPVRSLARPLGTLSAGDRLTVLAVQSVSNPQLLPLVERFGAATAGAARVRFVSAFQSPRAVIFNSETKLAEPDPDRVYSGEGTCLASLGPLGESGADGVVVSAAAGPDDIVRIWAGLPGLTDDHVWQLPGALIPERAELIAALFGERGDPPSLLVLPAQGSSVRLDRPSSDASFDIVNAVIPDPGAGLDPASAQTTLTVVDARGRIQDRAILLYGQTTPGALAKSIFVPSGKHFVLQTAFAGGQTHAEDIGAFEGGRQYGLVLAGSPSASDPDKRVRAVTYQFPDAATCQAKLNSNVLLTGFLHAGPDLAPADWGYIDAQGKFTRLLANLSFATVPEPAWVELPARMGSGAAARVGDSIVQVSFDDNNVSGCKLVVLAQPVLAKDNPRLIGIAH